MADETSCMDWTPTTPPQSLNSYPENYIPGGWPISAPSPTSQAFARPSPPGFLQTAAKRVCLGLGVIKGLTYDCSAQIASGATRAGQATQQLIGKSTQSIIQTFRRDQRQRSRRQAPLLTASPWRRATSTRQTITQAHASSTSATTARQWTRTSNTPHAAARTHFAASNPTSARTRTYSARRKILQPARRIHFTTPDPVTNRYSQGSLTTLFPNMPRLSPPKEAELHKARTPVHSDQETSPSCDRLVSLYPDLRPHIVVDQAQTPTPPASPSTQLLQELRSAEIFDNDSDVSSTLSDSWRPLKQRFTQQGLVGTAQANSPSPNSVTATIGDPVMGSGTSSATMAVNGSESTSNPSTADSEKSVLTPPPIKTRSYLAKSPESDISSTCDVSPGLTEDWLATQSIDLTKVGDRNLSTPNRQVPDHDTPEQACAQTPDQKLQQLTAELTIEDPHTPEHTTPKAQRHSLEKKTRLTRAQQKKIETEKDLLKYEILPLSDDWETKVRDAVRNGHGKLKASDFARVIPLTRGQSTDNWLNDEVINEYLSLIVQHGKQNDRKDQVPTYHAFTSFFFSNLEKKGHEGVKRWATRAKIGGRNLFQTDQVFIPINSGMHWTLGVVSGTDRKITHYNSLGRSGKRYMEVMKNWVKAELGTAYVEDEWSFEENGQSPQQQNMDDCGVFTITSARQIMLGFTPMSYKSNQIPIQRKRIVAELINGGLIKSHE